MKEKDTNPGRRPIIIIGAPRSGTNMLRDLLTKVPSFETWPCDEINYIWCHGNVYQASDELKPERASASVRKFIHKQFDYMANQKKCEYLIEKTCANSLRVPFVNKIFPDAKYIFITRDGRDVVSSAMHRWRASLNLKYILAKARFVPVSDLGYYGSRYLVNRIQKLLSQNNQLSCWGPRCHELALAQEKGASLAELCAIQWMSCVNESQKDLQKLDPKKVINIRYEDFVSDPKNQLKQIVEFIKWPKRSIGTNSIRIDSITTKSIGKWQRDLDRKTQHEIEKILSLSLSKLGYKTKVAFSEKRNRETPQSTFAA